MSSNARRKDFSAGGVVVRHGNVAVIVPRRRGAQGDKVLGLPKGHLDGQESELEAAIREVREETGLIVAPGRMVGSIQRPAGDGVYDIRDYAAEVTGGTLAAGDDADDTVWAGTAELAALPLTEGLLDTLRSWGAL